MLKNATLHYSEKVGTLACPPPRFSHAPKCPTKGNPLFFAGKPQFRIFSELGLAFRPTLGILRA